MLRKKTKPTAKVKDLQVGKEGVVKREAIAIDANWGVWVNPEAECMAFRHEMRDQQFIAVRATDSGYEVIFSSKHELENTPATLSFDGRGFKPAARVTLV